MELLPNIKSPKDLKKIKIEDTPKVAAEIRGVIVENISRSGGHLASSLGATDFIIALHYAFNTPKDKIVFDTGHQTYAHKILTGRLKQFNTLRQKGGISGFLKRDESKYDAFGAGHASTALSAACGMAEARDRIKGDYKVVAVVSDGCMTGGMSWEAMQNVGHLKTNILIVLNDNQMFISRREGMLGNILAKIIAPGTIQDTEKKLEVFLSRFKSWGQNAFKLAKRTKALFFPGMIFEEMGISYFGPIDGHNIKEMVEVFNRLKEVKGPVLLHLVTKKGKGYEPAEMEPTEFHGAGAFDVETGELDGNPGSVPSFTKVFSDAIVELADKDKKIMAITAAMPEGTGLDGFRDKYPNRYFDVGIAEEHAITFAAGLAAEGLKPIVNIYSTFMQRAFDQIMHDVCLQKLPVIMVMDRGGIVGDDGPTHHGVFDMSFLRILPNLVFMAPSNENELRNSLKTALTLNKPVAIRYPRGKGIGIKITDKFKSYKLGAGEWLKKGKDVNILAIGNRVYPALEAAKELKEKGIDAGVADMRFLKPLDGDLIKEALSLSNKIVTVEDNALMGGFGSSILEWLNANNQKADVFNMGIGDAFVEQGKPDELYEDLGISPDKITKRISDWIK